MFAPIAGQLRRTNNGSEDQPEWGNFLSDFRKGQPMAFIFFMCVMVDTFVVMVDTIVDFAVPA